MCKSNIKNNIKICYKNRLEEEKCFQFLKVYSLYAVKYNQDHFLIKIAFQNDKTLKLLKMVFLMISSVANDILK